MPSACLRPWWSIACGMFYVTHLTEDGIDRRFIQVQVGHECDSSTAIYTNPRELHQTGEKPQVAMSGRCSSGLSGVLGIAA